MNKQVAIIAAGCFWGVQAYFDRLEGVLETVVGYTGGTVPNPTYRQVCSRTTGHAEAVKVTFDTRVLSYEKLLQNFFAMHDPTQVNRQGPDVGDNYRSAIFYTNDEQKRIASKIIERYNAEHVFERPIATKVERAASFYEAEDYHQKYFDKTGMGACHIWPDQAKLL